MGILVSTWQTNRSLVRSFIHAQNTRTRTVCIYITIVLLTEATISTTATTIPHAGIYVWQCLSKEVVWALSIKCLGLLSFLSMGYCYHY